MLWWKQFQDPVLDELVAEALANNMNVKIAAPTSSRRRRCSRRCARRCFRKWATGAGAGRERSHRIGTVAGHRAGSSRIRRRPTRRCVTRAGRSTCGGASAGRARRRARTLLATDEARRGVVLSLVVVGRHELPAVARPRRAARHREADARRVRRVGQALQPAVQVRPDLADERRAGAVAVRDRRRPDPADRVADRADGEGAVDPARPQSRPDRARQVDRRPGAARRSGGRALGIARAPPGPACRPSRR